MQTCYMNQSTRTIADTIPGELIGMDLNTVVISRINVPMQYRGKGHGRTILKRILEDADREGITLCLEPLPSGGGD